MSNESDLYGDDILLWSQKQGSLLRRLATGEAVTEQVDWPNVVEEIEWVGRSRTDAALDGAADLEAITNDMALNASKALRGHFPKEWRRAMKTLADKIASQA